MTLRRPSGQGPLRQISRRGMIASGVLAGVLSAAGLPVAARQRGGVLRLGASGLAEGFDPRRMRGLFPRVLGQGAVYDTLTEITATGEVVGELAEHWESDATARTWVFRLRRGVTFHDGRALGAADAAASLLLHRDPASPAARILDRVADVRVVSPLELSVTLVEGNPDFPMLLADPHLIVGPDGRFDAGVGTGLYRLADYRPGEGARLVRVGAHYKDGVAGWFDAVILRAIPDPAARSAALLSGHLDAVDLDPAAAVPQNRKIRVIAVPGNAKRLVSLPHPLSADPRLGPLLRRALPRALADDHPVGPANARFAPLDPPEADPGIGAWFARTHGIDIDPAAGQLLSRVTAGRPTEDWAFAAALGPGGPWSALAGDGRLAAAIAAARAARDDAERRLLWAEAQALCAATGVQVVQGHVPLVLAHADRLAHGGRTGGRLALDDGRIAERWWFA